MLNLLEEKLRQERETSTLSRLDEDFFSRLQERIIILQGLSDPISKRNLELLKEGIKELIDVRAEKIVKGNQTHMLKEEFKLAEFASLFKKFKKDVLESLLQKETTTQRVIVLEDLPQFYGPDLEILGPYRKGEVVLLEKSVASLLKERGLIEER